MVNLSQHRHTNEEYKERMVKKNRKHKQEHTDVCRIAATVDFTMYPTVLYKAITLPLTDPISLP